MRIIAARACDADAKLTSSVSLAPVTLRGWSAVLAIVNRADAEISNNNANAALRELRLLYAYHDTVAAAARIHDRQPQKAGPIRLHENSAAPQLPVKRNAVHQHGQVPDTTGE